MSRPVPRAVLLFARSPRAEARRKGLPGAARLFAYGRDRVLAAVRALPGVDLVVVGEAGGGALPAGTRLLAQRGSTFGERLRAAFADVRALGYEHTVAVGIDAPTLGARQLAQAFAALATHPMVLAASRDGGVYLLGLAGDGAGRLRGVRWRTHRVFRDLLANGPAAVVGELATDVDGVADLPRLLRDRGLEPRLAALLAALVEPHVPAAAPRSAPLPSRLRREPHPRRGPPRPPAPALVA